MKKRNAFSLDEKMKILAQADAHMGTRVDLAARLGIPVSTLNTILKNRTDIEKNYARCGPSFSKDRKSMKISPLEELESILSNWFKQARTANANIDGSHLKEKALHIAARLGIDDFRASNGWIDRFKKRHNLVYKTVSGESASVDPVTVNSWKEQIHEVIQGYELKDIFNADETGLFFNLQPNKTLTYKGDPCHGGTKSKQRITVLLTCNADGSEKLDPLVIGKFSKPRCFKNIKKLPTKYGANSNAWMTSVIFEEYLLHLDRQMAAKNRKILLFIDQCAAHPKNTSALKNVKVVFFPPNCTSKLQPLDLGIIHAFKCHYRKQLIRKAVAMIDGGLLEDASKLKLNILSALHFVAEAWRRISSLTIQNCFRKCGFMVGTEDTSSIEDITTLYDEENDDWIALRQTDINFSDYITVDSDVNVCEIQTVDQVLEDHRSDQKEEEDADDDEDDEEEAVKVEEKVTFLKALEGLEVVRRYFQQFDVEDSVLVSCNMLENELYSVKQHEKKKQTTMLDWLKK